ncbi:hypothetical protein AAMO2058_000762700 [Amorphochlora amoebiformis]
MAVNWKWSVGVLTSFGIGLLCVNFREVFGPTVTIVKMVAVDVNGKPPHLMTIERPPLAAPRANIWGKLKPPYPTHAFWENFALGTGVDTSNAVTALPYITQATDYSLDLFYPYTSMATKTQFQLAFDMVVGRLAIGASTSDLSGGPTIDSYTDLGVTLKFNMQSGGVMKTHVVQGSPYVNYVYEGAKPMITSGQLLRRYMVDGKKADCNAKPIKGHTFQFSLLQFDETWIIYAYPPLELRCTASNPPMALQALGPYQGTLRVAISNNCTFGQSSHHCRSDGHGGFIRGEPKGYRDLLNKHASTMVTGGDVSYEFRDDKAHVSFNWHTVELRKNTSGNVKKGEALMLTLPHHRQVLDSDLKNKTYKTLAGHRSIHGVQHVLTGSRWNLTEHLSTIAWTAPRKVNDIDKINAIKAAAENDLKWELPWNYKTGTGDPYNAGKMMAKMANIAIIAEEMDVSKHKISKFLDPLEDALGLWLNGSSGNSLVYDASWGGVVSCGCLYSYPPPHCINKGPPHCPALGGDPVSNGFDFGNGAFNDHHFHYGYIIYAAAGLAKFRPEWGKKHQKEVLSLVRDIANANPKDRYFPRFRHTDWYSGHSWAGGIALPYLNGKNQESSSEAFNAWYGVSLWGRVSNDKHLRDIGRLLMSMEARAARTYWHIPEINDNIYPKEFAQHHTAGIIWQNLIQYQTWFGQLQWEVQGIQTLPVTPASEMYLTKPWSKTAAKLFESTCGGACYTDGWITFLCLLKAVNDDQDAWSCAEKLHDSVFAGEAAGGNGNSLSNTLYWIATREST